MHYLSIKTENGPVTVSLFEDENHDGNQIIQLLGLIPKFIKESDPINKGFRDCLEEQYGFPICEIGGMVDKDGTFSYTGDPDMEPLALYQTPTEQCYQYHCGIIAIITHKTTFITRMD